MSMSWSMRNPNSGVRQKAYRFLDDRNTAPLLGRLAENFVWTFLGNRVDEEDITDHSWLLTYFLYGGKT